MNALEKAELIKELQILLQQLDKQVLPLYQIARAKKRLHDIFGLCDEPIFKTQLLAFKARTQPEIAAYQFSASTLYHLSFRGYFSETPVLEKALYAQPDAGWAVLHQPQHGWQIWLIPAPQCPALHSEWDTLEQCYNWLLQQQQLSACLQADPSSLAVATLTPHQTEIRSGCVEPGNEHRQSAVAACHIQPPSSLDQPQNQIQHIPGSAETQPKAEAIIPETIAFPDSIQLGDLSASVHPLCLQDANLQQLCALELQSVQHPAYLDIALYSAAEDQWQARQVYVAEQLNRLGQLVKYLLLLGAPNQLQAQYWIKHWLDRQQRHCAAIKALSWSDLRTGFSQWPLFSQAYLQQTETVWTAQDCYRYIPADLIHTQKFIFFEEADADFSTPVLLLQEHQKIRVIHGEKRLALAPDELAYPHLLLQRNKQINWQNIHKIILAMPQPIHVLELYRQIQSQIIE